jgi:hypothetical protein
MIEVVWSNRAIHELDSILEFWYARNESDSYPHKILVASDEAIHLIKSYPNVGIATNHRNVKMRLVLDRYYLVYRFNEHVVEVLKFWDCRQDPESNPYLR